jgi:hypothetical protein
MSYKADYALSNRSVCKGCDEPIKLQQLRIGKMVRASETFFCGTVPLIREAAERRQGKNETESRGPSVLTSLPGRLHKIRWRDSVVVSF